MGVKVFMSHIREAVMCSRGARKLANYYGFNWQDFLDNGIDADLIREIDDAMVQRVVAIAEAGEQKHGQ